MSDPDVSRRYRGYVVFRDGSRWYIRHDDPDYHALVAGDWPTYSQACREVDFLTRNKPEPHHA